MEDLRVYGNKRVYMIVSLNDIMIDSFINISQNYLPGVQAYSFLDPLKDIARIYFDYDEANDSGKNHHFLRMFKYAADYYDDFCYKELLKVFDDFKKSEFDYMFVGVPQFGADKNNEIGKLQDALDAEIVVLHFDYRTEVVEENKKNYPARVDYTIPYSNDNYPEPEFKEAVIKFCDFIKDHNF